MINSKRSFLILFFLIVCLLPSHAVAEPLRFAMPDFCPFACDPSKEAGKEGFIVEILRKAFESHYTLSFEMFPYLRAVKLVQTGHYDGIVVFGKDFVPDLICPDRPTSSHRVAFYVKKETAWKYTGLKSLSTTSIGIAEGYKTGDRSTDDFLQKHADTKKVTMIFGEDLTQRGLNHLLHDRFKVFMEGEYPARYAVVKMGIQDRVVVAGYLPNKFPLFTGFTPHHPKAAQLAKTLEETISALERSGNLKDMMQRYGITHDKAPWIRKNSMPRSN